MNKYILSGVAAALLVASAAAPAMADHYGWHGPHREGWYFHPHWSGRHYIVAPVPAPVYAPPVPYYYPAPAYAYPAPPPVMVAPAPVIGIRIGR